MSSEFSLSVGQRVATFTLDVFAVYTETIASVPSSFLRPAARRWPSTISTSVAPGWVPTKMGGADAPEDLQRGFETPAWLAEGLAPRELAGGSYLYHQAPAVTNPAAYNTDNQDVLLAACKQMSGINWPPAPS